MEGRQAGGADGSCHANRSLTGPEPALACGPLPPARRLPADWAGYGGGAEAEAEAGGGDGGGGGGCSSC